MIVKFREPLILLSYGLYGGPDYVSGVEELREPHTHILYHLYHLFNGARELLKLARDAEVLDAALEIWALIHGFVSLRQHVTALKTEGTDWEDQVVRAVRIHIAALDQTRTS